MARIQARREDWQVLLEQMPVNKGDAMLLRCLKIGEGIVDIQKTIE